MREWNTPVREPWNPVISNILKAIDNHTSQYMKDGNVWHLQKAHQLRGYVVELKDWIVATE
jgi:hypothetical protein